LSLFLIDLCFATPLFFTPMAQSAGGVDLSAFLTAGGSNRIMVDFAGIAISSGLFTVPLYALIQERCRREWLSRAIALNNMINALFMVVSAGFLILLYSLHVSMPKIFLILGALNVSVSIYIYMLVPEFTLRFLSWILIHLIYRPKTTGLENIPEAGPAILICNHVSYVDWLILSGAIRRPIRFVMYYKFAEIPLLRYLLRQAHVIPIAGFKEDPKLLEAAFARVHVDLLAGELICVFPEGRLTRDGELSEFRNGVERMLAQDPVPVIPMAIRGLWGSLFSFEGGAPLLKAPKKLWKAIEVKIGSAMNAADANAQTMQSRVVQLLEHEELAPLTVVRRR
jgi:1-acyl-sn-glycerol-3-phosphate acyltransferase